MFKMLKVSIPTFIFLTSSLVLGHDGECTIACGRVENSYASTLYACYGTTVAAITEAGFPNSICSIWNNNGILEGAGGPDPNPGNEPCLCWYLSPGGMTGVGGISEQLDPDWFTFFSIDYSVEWDTPARKHPPKTIPKGQYTKINDLEKAVCKDVAGKPHCTITW